MKYIKYWLILCVTAVCCMSSTACSKSVEQQIIEQMELGRKYLTELDYEKAVIAFEKAIEIDPKAFDAYAGVAQVYASQKKYDNATEVLKNGQSEYAGMEEKEHTDSTKAAYEILKATAIDIIKPIAEQAETEEEYERALKYYELMFLFDDTEKESITNRVQMNIEKRDLMDDVRAEFSILKDPSDKEIISFIDSLAKEDVIKMIGEGDRCVFSDNGKGIGLYRCNYNGHVEYFTYYGEYVNKKREGSGIWVIMFSHPGYRAIGEWLNDMPNGYQIAEWASLAHEKEMVWDGNVVNGVWEGKVTQSWISGTTIYVSFKNGKYVVLDDTEKERYGYLVYKTGGESWYIPNPDEVQKILGF